VKQRARCADLSLADVTRFIRDAAKILDALRVLYFSVTEDALLLCLESMPPRLRRKAVRLLLRM